MDRGRFSNHFRLSVDKMCFPSSVCKRFLKKCWRAQFHLKMAKVLTRFFCSFIISISTIDRGRFSSHFLLSVEKMCFPSPVCESFLKKCWRAQFYLKMVKNWSDFFGDLSFQFQRPQRTGVDFPNTFFYPRIKCVFLLQAVKFFSKNADVENFISKWRRPWADFFGDLSFQFQRPQWTVVDFPATSLYPGIKCVFLLQAVRVFWKKAYVLNFISKWPIFLVIYPFNSNAHNGHWSIFQPLPHIRG